MRTVFLRRFDSFVGIVALALILSTPWGVSTGIASATDFSYDNFAKVLGVYVDERGMVDYQGLKAHRKPLDDFIASLSRLAPKIYEGWTDKAKPAFWINAYNALTLKAIIDHYPIEASLVKSFLYPKNSIRQIPGVWDKLTFTVMGKDMTLDGIEHNVLRPTFNEPRIHVALVCAAMGCPPLRNEPYTGGKLDAQLDDQATTFLKQKAKFRVDRNAGKVLVSPIFDWFGQDFVKNYATEKVDSRRSEKDTAIIEFIRRYAGPADQTYLSKGGLSIEYLKYDWSLNEKSR
ncbi:MAG: DUF547 domain-containing protein [Pseudomonadota bacterium]